jgi:hypothetical protein
MIEQAVNPLAGNPDLVTGEERLCHVQEAVSPVPDQLIVRQDINASRLRVVHRCSV